jgi:hypothetical protein
MRVRCFLWSFGTITLAGCGTHVPELVSERVLPIEALVASIDCEFQDAVRTQIYHRPGRQWLRTWQGQYTVTLKGNETGGVKLASSTNPILLPRGSTLNLGVGGGGTTTANRIAILKFNLDFATVRDGPRCEPPPAYAAHPLLKGRIGFEDWMDRAFDGALSESTIAAKTSDLASIGHSFEFSIDLNANASPAFVIMPAPATTITPTGTIDRLEDNIVEVSLGKAAAGTASQTKTTANYAKLQLEALQTLEKEIKDLSDKICGDKKTLAENKEVLQRADQLQKFTVPAPEATIQGLRPEARSELLGKQSEAREFFAANADTLATLRRTQNETKQDEQSLSTKKGQMLDTINHPASTTVVQRTVRTPAPLPADQNPNVASTSLQLTLERLNNTLRVPAF